MQHLKTFFNMLITSLTGVFSIFTIEKANKAIEVLNLYDAIAKNLFQTAIGGLTIYVLIMQVVKLRKSLKNANTTNNDTNDPAI